NLVIAVAETPDFIHMIGRRKVQLAFVYCLGLVIKQRFRFVAQQLQDLLVCHNSLGFWMKCRTVNLRCHALVLP
ncbi:MAG: hypothetical protein K0Q66_299, partial [Chitinophagaceae bacterium]|nr:hypothetical protein [Chitinophagaceae bacterium]